MRFVLRIGPTAAQEECNACMAYTIRVSPGCATNFTASCRSTYQTCWRLLNGTTTGFKVGEHTFHVPDLDQVVDYALDLNDFDEGSHDAYVAPVLVCTRAHRTHLHVPATRPTDRVFRWTDHSRRGGFTSPTGS
jgi:hypothetical protein